MPVTSALTGASATGIFGSASLSSKSTTSPGSYVEILSCRGISSGSTSNSGGSGAITLSVV